MGETESQLRAVSAECLSLLWKRDLDQLLDYFQEDAVISEPISKVGKIKGRAEIANFFVWACNIAKGAEFRVTRVVSLQSRGSEGGSNQAIITVDFKKGGTVTYNFYLDYVRLAGKVPIGISSIDMTRSEK